MDTDLTGADLTGCRIYGVSAWDLKLEGTKQQNLVITPEDEPEITVDNIEVAQFIYLMLHNQKIRDVIDTITSKAVLILGRFTDERKAVLDALREELRKRDYLPILFDFDVPATRDITETVSLLARMARFIIADLTDPSSIPKELEAIVPHLAVPVQPLLEGASRPYAMFKDYWKYDWVLPVYRYEGLEPLLATLADKVIAPAEGKVKALQERRRDDRGGTDQASIARRRLPVWAVTRFISSPPSSGILSISFVSRLRSTAPARHLVRCCRTGNSQKRLAARRASSTAPETAVVATILIRLCVASDSVDDT